MRLADCFMEPIAYVAYFLKTVDAGQPAYETVRAEIDRLVTENDRHCENENFPAEEYDMARFAVFAWIDEAVLNSGWREKNRWQGELLQRVHYQTTNAGELFYERLNTVGYHQRDVREVYYLCLALGFTGRHCHPGDDFLLRQLKNSNLKLLTGTPAGPPPVDATVLFPEAYGDNSGKVVPQNKRGGFSAFNALWIGIPVVAFGLSFLLYRFFLDGLVNSLLAPVL